MTQSLHTKPGPILPRGRAEERSLLIIMTVMAFLSALSFLFATVGFEKSRQWQNSLDRAATIHLLPDSLNDTDAMVSAALDALTSDHPDLTFEALSESRSKDLLEPWIGSVELPDDLPLPQIISVTSQGAPIDTDTLHNSLAALNIDADIDDHGRWQNHISRVWQWSRIALWTILFIILTGSVAVVSFATRATLKIREDILSLLSDIGAPDLFIMFQFGQRFFKLSLLAVLIAALFTWVFFTLVALWMGQSEPPLFPSLSPSFSQWLGAICLLLGFVALTTFTALGTVFIFLRSNRIGHNE